MTKNDAAVIVGLGEAMIRLSARDHEPLAVARDFRANVAGAELNLLIAAAQLGARARWLTRLPENELGLMMRAHAQSFGVEVCAVEEAQSRAGLFFLETGATPRPSRVLYDRRDSAASHLGPEDFEWTEVLRDARVAHLTGITPALGERPLAASRAFMSTARELGLVTSFDVNYRSQLWGLPEARAALTPLLALSDIVFAGPGDLVVLTGREGSGDDLARHLLEGVGVSTVVLRERVELGDDQLGVTVRVRGQLQAEATASGRVVDQLGAGDAAAGAFLASMMRGDSGDRAAAYCANAYARTLTLPGDSFTGSWVDLEDGFSSSRRLVR